MGEFELIRRYFSEPAKALSDEARVPLGIGDDCALLTPAPGMSLAVSSDMLVQGRHFFADVAPDALGHKALAVNLSDLAAMGARPLGFTLSLALPSVDGNWLEPFSKGMLALASRYGCPLVGGDTTRGPLTLCITVLGEVPLRSALRRDAARVGDDIWVSGYPGEARLALEGMLGTPWAQAALQDPTGVHCRQRLEWPEPRLPLGVQLARMAAEHQRQIAALDVSDGLAGDLGHILAASGVGAILNASALPMSPALQALPPALALECLMHGGDDYELVFTAPSAWREALEALDTHTTGPVHRIGHITADTGLRLADNHGQCQPWQAKGFDHFSP